MKNLLYNKNLKGELRMTSEEEIAYLKQEIVNMKYHHAFDMIQLKAKHHVFLKETVVPYLSDAVDALEIEPNPSLSQKTLKNAAIRRINAVMNDAKKLIKSREAEIYQEQQK